MEAVGGDTSASSPLRALRTAQEAEDLVAKEVEVRLNAIITRRPPHRPVTSIVVGGTEGLF